MSRGNKWFGESWGADCCDPASHMDTPVGATCVHCDEPIAEKDNGMVDAGGSIFHRPCFMRLLGSFGHNMGLCSCTIPARARLGIFRGMALEDLPGLTKRENAQAAEDALCAREGGPEVLNCFMHWMHLSHQRAHEQGLGEPEIRIDDL